MKKAIIFSLLVSFLFVSSCVKEPAKIFGCTNSTAPNYNAAATNDNGSCIDYTASIVGVYHGQARAVAPAFDTTVYQDVRVSKIDNKTIRIQPAYNTATYTFTANLTQQSDGYIVTVPYQSTGSETIQGNSTCTGCNAVAHGAYQTASGAFVYAILIDGGLGEEYFQGYK